MKIKPNGWNAGASDTRFADVAPQSFDKGTRTVDCVISMGSPVQRFYGTEVLEISPKAVDLNRMQSGGIPLLDSHNQNGIDNHLGRFTQTWFNRGSLMGKISFNETERGQMAMGMVERGEIAGISAGYIVREWKITDTDGNVIDPETTRINIDDDLTFTASRWELLEASLVSVPADAKASIRSFGSGQDRVVPQIEALARGAVKITKRFGDASITYEYPPAVKSNAVDEAEARARMLARQRVIDRILQS